MIDHRSVKGALCSLTVHQYIIKKLAVLPSYFTTQPVVHFCKYYISHCFTVKVCMLQLFYNLLLITDFLCYLTYSKCKLELVFCGNNFCGVQLSTVVYRVELDVLTAITLLH